MRWNGYVIDKCGKWSSPVDLHGPAEVWWFAFVHRQASEVRIVEEVDDAINFQVREGRLTFPDDPATQRAWKDLCEREDFQARIRDAVGPARAEALRLLVFGRSLRAAL